MYVLVVYVLAVRCLRSALESAAPIQLESVAFAICFAVAGGSASAGDVGARVSNGCGCPRAAPVGRMRRRRPQKRPERGDRRRGVPASASDRLQRLRPDHHACFGHLRPHSDWHRSLGPNSTAAGTKGAEPGADERLHRLENICRYHSMFGSVLLEVCARICLTGQFV